MSSPSSAVVEAMGVFRRASEAQQAALDALGAAIAAERGSLTEELDIERAALGAVVASARCGLAEDRAALAHDRAALAAQAALRASEIAESTVAAAAASSGSAELVKLNVGGVRYESSFSTLSSVPGSMLALMFRDRLDMLKRNPDDGGSVFIDRDGDRFGKILDFLRHGDAPRFRRTIRQINDPDAQQRGMMVMFENEALLRDLDYFGLQVAVFGAWSWIADATFDPGPEMLVGRASCAAVADDGSVYVFGGTSGRLADEPGLPSVATTEVWRCGTAGFAPGPAMGTARLGCAAVILEATFQGGISSSAPTVLVCGGRGPSGKLASTELLDTGTMALAPGPRMAQGRCYCTAVPLDAHRVLICGGLHGRGTVLSSTEILDVGTMEFTAGPTMQSRRSSPAAVALDDRRVMILGGWNGADHLASTEILDVDALTFRPGPSMLARRSSLAAVQLDPQHVLVVGGYSSQTCLNSTEVLHLETMSFAPGPPTATARASSALLQLDPSRVAVLGGFFDRSDATLPTTEIIDVTNVAPSLPVLLR